MILWRNTENYPVLHMYHFYSDPRFPPFLLYVRWKSWVTFVRRCFRDGRVGEQNDKAPRLYYFFHALAEHGIYPSHKC